MFIKHVNLDKIGIIGLNTFREVYRSKLMITSFIGLAIVLLSAKLATMLTFGTPKNVALNIGFGLSGIISIGIAIFIGVTLFSKEEESRTIYMVLSKPLSRLDFVLGKIFGLTLFQLVNSAILIFGSITVYLIQDGKLTGLLLIAALFAILESLIVLLFVLLMSLVTNTALSVITTIIFIIVSHAVPKAIEYAGVEYFEKFKGVLKGISFFIPNLEMLNLKPYVLYSEFLPSHFILYGAAHFFFYFLALLVLVSYIFIKKDLN